MDLELIRRGVIFFLVLVVSLSFHEWAHAWVAYKLGDSTAYEQGRVSLNPLNHLDPMGTLFLLIISFAGVGIGWAKPVPINPYNLKRWERDSMLISVAGPLANLFLAAVVFVLYGLLNVVFQTGLSIDTQWMELLSRVLVVGAWCNISLFIFNMLPFVPLDGSKVYPFFLPKRFRIVVNQILYKIGYIPLMIMLVSEFMFEGGGLFSLIFSPVYRVIGLLFMEIRHWL
ncbi:MAG: site-2 protease family protein [Fibrobacterales bacterium]